MKRTDAVMALLMLLAVGCATSGRTAKLRAEMTRNEVETAMGAPTSANLADGVEYLQYNLTEHTDHGVYGLTHGEYVPYVVRLKDGRVNGYGRAIEFDPAVKVNVRQESLRQ